MIITLLYSTDFFYTVSSIQYVTRVHTYIYIKMNGGRRPNQGRGTANQDEPGRGKHLGTRYPYLGTNCKLILKARDLCAHKVRYEISSIELISEIPRVYDTVYIHTSHLFITQPRGTMQVSAPPCRVIDCRVGCKSSETLLSPHAQTTVYLSLCHLIVRVQCMYCPCTVHLCMCLLEHFPRGKTSPLLLPHFYGLRRRLLKLSTFPAWQKSCPFGRETPWPLSLFYGLRICSWFCENDKKNRRVRFGETWQVSHVGRTVRERFHLQLNGRSELLLGDAFAHCSSGEGATGGTLSTAAMGEGVTEEQFGAAVELEVKSLTNRSSHM